MKLRKLVALSLALVLVLALVPATFTVSADDSAKIVTNGLVANFDANGHSASDAEWKDETGKYSVTVPINSTNYFTGTAYHLSGVRVKLSDDLLNCVNARQFTVEMRFGKIEKTGSSYTTVLNSSNWNDEFSLFINSSTNILQLKSGGSSANGRPQSADGKNLLEYSTTTFTFDLDAGVAKLYVDGTLLDTKSIGATIGATGYFAFGHDGADRAHTADYEAMRFYNRALTADEVAQNAKADGNYKDMTIMYANASDSYSNILNAPAGVMLVESASAFNSFKSMTSKPSNLMVKVKNGSVVGGMSVADVFNACDSTVIPNFLVYDKNSAKAVIDYINEKNIIDASICAATDAETLVPYIKDLVNKSVRVGMVYTDIGANGLEKASSAKIHNIRLAVNTVDANFVILPSTAALQSNVRALRDLNVVTWVMDTGSMDGTLDLVYCVSSGASGIITSRYTELLAYEKTLAANTLTTTPLVIGHRGNPTNAPENSISGYLLAVENGADVVETDIYLTKDNQIVIMHDSTIARTTSYTGSAAISTMTLAEIKEYNLWGENNKFKNQYPEERVPSFEEMLVALKDLDCKIFVEFKDSSAACVKEFVRLVQKYGYADRICVISFGSNALTEVHKQLPEMSTGFLLGNIPAYSGNSELQTVLYQQITFMQSCGSSLNISYPNMTEEFVDALEMRGFAIWPWTLSTGAATASNNLFLWGVEGITTNDCQYYKNTVESLSVSTYRYINNVGATTDLGIKTVTYGGVVTNVSSAAKYTVLSGSDVISIENGVVTAKKQGNALVIANYTCKLPDGRSYVLYTDPIEVQVGGEARASDLVLNGASKYDLGDEYLASVTEKTKVSALAGNFDCEVTVFNSNGKELNSNDVVGTGCVVATMLGSGIYDSRVIVVSGDVDGDGVVGPTDYIQIKRYVVDPYHYDLSGAYFEAGDVFGNDSCVDAMDYILVKRHVVGILDLNK